MTPNKNSMPRNKLNGIVNRERSSSGAAEKFQPVRGVKRTSTATMIQQLNKSQNKVSTSSQEPEMKSLNPESSRTKEEHAVKKVNVLHKQDSSKYLKSSQLQQHEKVLKRAMRGSVDQARLSTGSNSVGPIAKAGKSSIFKITSGVTERNNTQSCLLTS